MDIQILVILAVLAIIIVVTVVILLNRNKKVVVSYDNIVRLFENVSVESIGFVRNKIVVEFKDVAKFDVDLLKQEGGKGINIVGDKVKFFVSDDKEVNEAVYFDIKNKVEGQ